MSHTLTVVDDVISLTSDYTITFQLGLQDLT